MPTLTFLDLAKFGQPISNCNSLSFSLVFVYVRNTLEKILYTFCIRYCRKQMVIFAVDFLYKRKKPSWKLFLNHKISVTDTAFKETAFQNTLFPIRWCKYKIVGCLEVKKEEKKKTRKKTIKAKLIVQVVSAVYMMSALQTDMFFSLNDQQIISAFRRI